MLGVTGYSCRRGELNMTCRIAFGMLAFVSAGLAHAGSITVLALAGSDAPGGMGQLWAFDEPVIDDGGRVVYKARAGSSSGSSDDVYVLHGDGPPRIVLAEGDTVPGGDGTFWMFSDNLAVSPSGLAVFLASLDDTSFSSDSGLFTLDLLTGETAQLAREGNPTPAGGLFGRFSVGLQTPLLNTVNTSGQSVFVEEFYGDGVTSARDFGAFLAHDGNIDLVAAEGDTFPSFRQGSVPMETLSSMSMNDAGDIAFYAGLGGIYGDEGVFKWSDGTLNEVALVDQATPAGGTYAEFRTVVYTPINNAGQIAFRADVELGVGGNPQMIFRAGDTGTVVIARFGDPIPGTDDSIYNISRDVALNDAGQVLLEANDGPNGDRFLVLGNGTSQTYIAVPDTPTPCGDFFDGTIYEYALNNAGQVAFTARSAVPGKGSSSWRRGLYMYTPGVGTECLIRVDDQLDGMTVSTVRLRPAAEAGSMRADGINDAGAVAFFFETQEGPSGIAAAGLTVSCGPADLAEPFGLLDLTDITTFVTAFVANDNAADLDGSGLLDLADITAFATAFLAGCPG